jgi:hypothetical protein
VYIFDEKYLTLQSNKDNMIAFQISLQLLTKILAAAMAIEADSIQVRSISLCLACLIPCT